MYYLKKRWITKKFRRTVTKKEKNQLSRELVFRMRSVGYLVQKTEKIYDRRP